MEASRATSVDSIASRGNRSDPSHSARALGSNGEAAAAGRSYDTPSVSNEDKQLQPVVEDGERQGKGILTRIRERSLETISHEESSLPLAWQALLTGMIDALLYAKSAIWTGFQTGNMVQFSQNIAQYMLPQAERYPLLTLLRTLSILSFLLGSFMGAKGGTRWGDKNRGWQTSSAIIQSIFLFGASAILLSRPEDEPPSFRYFPGVVVMTAFSMGMQSIAAQKLVSAAFATTVAFTATLTQIASDPYLFTLSLAPIDEYRARRSEKGKKDDLEPDLASQPRKPPRTLGRDRRVLGIVFLCTGAGVAECLLYSRAGCRGGLTIAAGFKLLQALLWFIVPRGQKPVATK